MRPTITNYMKNNPGAINPRKAAEWVVRCKHLINTRRVFKRDDRSSYYWRCFKSLIICDRFRDDEYPVSPKIAKAIEVLGVMGR